jgi:hypothetical protein
VSGGGLSRKRMWLVEMAGKIKLDVDLNAARKRKYPKH